MNSLTSGQLALDIFVFEGTVVNAPNGTGEWNRFAGRPMKDWVADLAKVASYTVAIGDCATWGGIPATAPNPSDSEGLQFLKRKHGGFLGAGYKSKAGLPVINVPGCPAHPDWITQIVVAVATGRGGDLSLDEFQRPKTFFTSFTQTGCTRNMHFAYKVSATEYGQRKGCLFYDLGCRGPMTHSPCNRILWNRQSSKTRAGMPCMGCTEPEFPFSCQAPSSRRRQSWAFRRTCRRGSTRRVTSSSQRPQKQHLRPGPKKTCSSFDGNTCQTNCECIFTPSCQIG